MLLTRVYLLAGILSCYLGDCFGEQKYHLYVYKHYKLSWSDAKQFCEGYGARLIKLDSLDKHTNLFNYFREIKDEKTINRKYYWIGLENNTDTTCSSYYWPDGDPITWTHWNEGRNEPRSCSSYKCVMMKDGFWRTSSCDKKREFICEKEYDVCNFVKHNNIDITVGSTDVLDMETTLVACKRLCRKIKVDGMDCVAVRKQQNEDNQCSLLFSSDDFPVEAGAVTSTGTSLYYRSCLKVDVIEDSYPAIPILPGSAVTDGITGAQPLYSTEVPLTTLRSSPTSALPSTSTTTSGHSGNNAQYTTMEDGTSTVESSATLNSAETNCLIANCTDFSSTDPTISSIPTSGTTQLPTSPWNSVSASSKSVSYFSGNIASFFRADEIFILVYDYITYFSTDHTVYFGSKHFTVLYTDNTSLSSSDHYRNERIIGVIGSGY